MATWGPFTANGNTSPAWILSGGNITNHEVFAPELQTTSPTNTTGLALAYFPIGYVNATRYNVGLSVKGAQAVTYEINSNEV